MTRLTDCIGPAADQEDFSYRNLTPEFEYYADDVKDGFEGTPDEIPVIPVSTPVLGDNYACVSLSRPRGLAMAIGFLLIIMTTM